MMPAATAFQTLTLAEIEAYRGQGPGVPSGKYLRFFCPIHGSDNQRSLSVNTETGRFRCFNCQATGYVVDFRRKTRRESAQNRHMSDVSWAGSGNPLAFYENAPRSQIRPPEEPKPRKDLAELLKRFQEQLDPRGHAAEYLRRRGIPLEVAKKYGVGFAPFMQWPARSTRQWTHGRLVFPHTNPAGEVVNLYGRAVEVDEPAEKKLRHDHLPGPKGVFNAPALREETVFVCEGVFDALSLIAAGYPNACAVFGLDGLRWEWVKARRIVFCFDTDDVATFKRDKLAFEAMRRGIEPFFLPREAFQGHKDLNELWVATGRLVLGEFVEPRECSEKITPDEAGRLEAEAFKRVETLCHREGFELADLLRWAAEARPQQLAECEALTARMYEARDQQDGQAFRDLLRTVEAAFVRMAEDYARARFAVDVSAAKEEQRTYRVLVDGRAVAEVRCMADAERAFDDAVRGIGPTETTVTVELVDDEGKRLRVAHFPPWTG